MRDSARTNKQRYRIRYPSANGSSLSRRIPTFGADPLTASRGSIGKNSAHD